ncbi:12869_t:CDS:2, partial [Funneliformis mosseae]
IREKGKAKLIVNNDVDFKDNYISLRKRKGKAKVIVIDDVNFKNNRAFSSENLNNASSGEKLNNVSSIANAKSEIDEHSAHETFKMNNQQANNVKPNKRKPKILDESNDDTLNNYLKILE